MGFDPEKVSTVTFDSYSTLVDVDAAEKALAERVDDPQPVSKLWRARSLEYTFVANAIDAYQPFYEMNRERLARLGGRVQQAPFQLASFESAPTTANPALLWAHP